MFDHCWSRRSCLPTATRCPESRLLANSGHNATHRHPFLSSPSPWVCAGRLDCSAELLHDLAGGVALVVQKVRLPPVSAQEKLEDMAAALHGCKSAARPGGKCGAAAASAGSWLARRLPQPHPSVTVTAPQLPPSELRLEGVWLS